MKIRSKIALMSLCLVLITSISIVSVLVYQLEYVQQEIEDELSSVELEQTKNVLNNTVLMVEALQSEVERRLYYDLNAAFALLASSGGVAITDSRCLWDVQNQYDHSAGQVELPSLNFVGNDGLCSEGHWKSPTTEHFIGHVSEVLGVTCTLFQRMNESGDMLRIATTVPSSKGQAAVGTYIPAVHPDGSADPVIGKVLQGETFIGRAFVVNDWYNTAYRPLYDEKNHIIGMLYVGERQSDLDSLIHSIQHVTAGSAVSAGSLFMLEAHKRDGIERQAVVQEIHPTDHVHKHSSYRDKNSDPASLLISWLLDEKQILLETDVKVIRGETIDNETFSELKNSLIVYRYFAPWDWVVGISLKNEGVSSTHRRLDVMLKRTIVWVSVTAFLWFSLALFLAYRLATQISYPLEVAIDGFRRIGRGELDYELLDESGHNNYEIDELYRSFDLMVKNLQQVTASRNELDVEVNARRHIEEELQHTVATLETIINEAPMSIIVVTTEGKVVLWNPTAEKMFGWKAEEVLGEIYPLVKGDEMTAECLDYKHLVENGIVLHAKELQRYHKDGHKLDLLVSAASMVGFGSGCDDIVILLEDISDLKKTQRQLEEREEQYKLLSAEFKSILDSIEDSISVISPDMKILWCNHGEKRWNKSEEILPLTRCFDMWNKDPSECVDCSILKSFKTGESQKSLRVTKDGTRWGIKTFPQKNDKGEVTNVIEVASDITESSILKEEAMRSARLASLGELSAGIAHEINNPNGVIMQNAPMLKEMMDSMLPVLDEYAEEHGDFTLGRMPYSRLRERILQLPQRIQDSSIRIKCIVDDLKDFVRDEGRQEAQTEGYLNYALEAAVRLTANSVKKATKNFNIRYGEDLPPFVGSLQRIEQVIVNLIMNACQALPDMEAAINITTRYNEALNQVELEVADEGCGISEENLNKVTNPFFTTKRETGGTGLGMSISSRIIEEHGGRLTIDSVVDFGTSITISLPCSKEAS
jgi:PAS domain S-box-containing protein